MQASEGTIWEIMAAVGTFGAVVVALSLPALRAWWSRPKLELEYKDAAPFRREGSADFQGKWTKELWIRVRIINRGRTAVRRCVVRAMEVRSSGVDPSPRGASGVNFDPLTLLWSGTSNQEARTLNRGDYELADVAKLQQWHGPVGLMELVTGDAIVKGQGNAYSCGQYDVRIGVYAENTAPLSRWIYFDLKNEIESSEVRLK